MSTLTALARAQAVAAGRAQPIATVRHLHVHDRPYVLVPLAMAGEANAPLAALAGADRSDPLLLVVAQPRNRDQRFAFAAALGDSLASYLRTFTGGSGGASVLGTFTEAVAVDRGRDVRYRYLDAPQLWVPTTGGVEFLRLFGRSTRFRSVDGDHPVPPAVPLLGRWLTFFAQSAEMPGASLLLNAVQAVGLHWASGQSAAEDAQLATLLAWITSGAAAAASAEQSAPSAGPATDPDFDNRVLAPLLPAEDVPALTTVLRGYLMPTWELMWQAMDVLRALPAGARVASRWDGDRDAFSAFAEHLDAGGPPQPRRDGAVAAAARLQRLETAATRYAVQRAFDDPLVMAEHRLTGNAFAGTVTLADPGRIDDTGRRPVLRPRIMVRTSEPVRVEPGAALTSPARPGQKATVISLIPAGSCTDVLLELSGGMGRKLTAEPGSVPAVGESLLLTTLSEAYRPPSAFPDAADTPWTHGGPPQPADFAPPSTVADAAPSNPAGLPA